MRFIKKMKPLFSALILTFVASFMFFIFEPILLYTNNINDFWFDIYDIFPLLFPAFIATFLVIFLICVEIYIICAKIIGKINLYYYFMAFFGCVFLITYIQGNFLAGSLPGLNGSLFRWREYPIDSAISIILWIVIFVAAIITIWKIKIKKFNNIISWFSGAIFIMLSISLISTIITHSQEIAEDKTPYIATYNHYNDASNNRNFFIFLVDCVDSQIFNELLKDSPEYKETFKDFTYYPDTTSYYPYTVNSIPQIITQDLNLNQTDFRAFSKQAYTNSELFKNLESNSYQISFYDVSTILEGETAQKIKNMTPNVSIDPARFYSEIVRYNLFKYLPFPLKGKPHIEASNFSSTAVTNSDQELFLDSDLINNVFYTTHPINIIEDNVFHFIHLEGAHKSYNVDENLIEIDPTTGTYRQKVLATFKTINSYLKRLQEFKVYDNSAIIILSDHGYEESYDTPNWQPQDVLQRFNPILYIKGIDENHSKMAVSNKPISFVDLGSAYNDLLLGKPSTELFSEISYPRTRKMLVYFSASHPEYLEEYETTGSAWDTSLMTPTGATYQLESH